MKIHLRIPRFQAVTAALEQNVDGPLVVVDDGRILDANEQAIERELSPNDLLETTTIPEDVKQTSFDLDRLETYQRTFHEAVQSAVPLSESFGFGEVLAEVPGEPSLEDLPEFPDLPEELTPCLAGSPTSWLSRLLCHRLAPGDVQLVADEQYQETLNSVKREELWGLGSELPRGMREESIETLGALRAVEPSERRERIGSAADALDALYAKRDPRPLNPFSRPASLRQGFSTAGEAKDRLRSKLKSTVRSLSESLRKTRTRTHRLQLTYSPGKQEPSSATYVYSTPTDEEDVLLFGVDSLLEELEPLDKEGDLHVDVNALVPNLESYHATVEENPEDLTVL